MDATRIGELFEWHGQEVYRYLKRCTGQAAVAEELTQDVFLRLLRAMDGYEARGRDVAWVFRVARNVAIDYRRRDSRRPHLVDADPDAYGRPAADFSLQDALARLDETDRDLFLLRELAGLTYDELAQETGLTTAAVRSRLYRARMALRAALRCGSRTSREMERDS
jgi:RNA polymerase sigma-70 factor, ECF subfamily